MSPTYGEGRGCQNDNTLRGLEGMDHGVRRMKGGSSKDHSLQCHQDDGLDGLRDFQQRLNQPKERNQEGTHYDTL